MRTRNNRLFPATFSQLVSCYITDLLQRHSGESLRQVQRLVLVQESILSVIEGAASQCKYSLYIAYTVYDYVVVLLNDHFTRKLCYRKDDRAMHPIHGCPENFRDSLTTPTATIPNIFTGFCSDRPSQCSYQI